MNVCAPRIAWSKAAIVLCFAATILAGSAARAELLYTYTYDLTQFEPGVAGSWSFATPNFITNGRFVPAINAANAAGGAIEFVEIRNAFHPADGSPLDPNPVINFSAGGFGIDSFVPGPLDHTGTFIVLDLGPHDRASLTIASTPDGFIRYSYDYDLTQFDPDFSGNWSFVAPTFITTATRFGPVSHDDPAGHPLEFFEFRNPFQPLDDSLLAADPVVETFMEGFGIDSKVTGPLDHVGTFTAFDFGEHDRATLTISGTAESVAVPEPASALVLLPALVAGWRWRRRRARV